MMLSNVKELLLLQPQLLGFKIVGKVVILCERLFVYSFIDFSDYWCIKNFR